MTTEGLAIEVRHADRLCYAMQQSAVPWLHGLTLRNDGPDARAELVVKVCLQGFSDRVECRVDELPVGASLELDAPDLPLRADAFAAAVANLEGVAAEVVDDWRQVAEGMRSCVTACRGAAADFVAWDEQGTWAGSISSAKSHADIAEAGMFSGMFLSTDRAGRASAERTRLTPPRRGADKRVCRAPRARRLGDRYQLNREPQHLQGCLGVGARHRKNHLTLTSVRECARREAPQNV